jgi:hypothetical protein
MNNSVQTQGLALLFDEDFCWATDLSCGIAYKYTYAGEYTGTSHGGE